MAMEIFCLLKKAWGGDEFFSKMILHAPSLFGDQKFLIAM
jgi:hypothetical protein